MRLVIARASPLAVVIGLALLSPTLIGCAGEGTPAPPVAPVPDVFIRFHLIEENAVPRLETRVFEGETLHLDAAMLASDPEMQRPRLTPEAGRWSLDVRFTANGGVQFDRAALDHHGRRVAVVVESRVVRVVTVRSQFGASRLLIDLILSEAEASRMQESIDRRWP